jgi:hypothetical protein
MSPQDMSMDTGMSPRATATLSILTLAFTAMPAAAADPSASAAKPHRAPRCHVPAGAEVLARGPRLVMWLATRSRRNPAPPPPWLSSETYAACVPPRGPTRVIARFSEEGSVECGSSISLEHAGSYVASVTIDGCSTGSWQALDLHDVLRGHTSEVISYAQAAFQSPETPASLQPLGAPFGLGINRFALDARGDVAWSGSNDAGPGEASLDILYLHDAAGTRRVAAAPSIGRVAFTGDELTWRASGSAHSVAG